MTIFLDMAISIWSIKYFPDNELNTTPIEDQGISAKRLREKNDASRG
jgi:hypothetical protein